MRNKNEIVDVDKRGKGCKEKMLSVLVEEPLVNIDPTLFFNNVEGEKSKIPHAHNKFNVYEISKQKPLTEEEIGGAFKKIVLFYLNKYL